MYTNPLDWWRIHEPRFPLPRSVPKWVTYMVYGNPFGHRSRHPLLAELSRRILCIPATSAPSERVFSAAGLTISKKKLKKEISKNENNNVQYIFVRLPGPQSE